MKSFYPPIVAIAFESYAVPGGGHWMGRKTVEVLKTLQSEYGTILIEDATISAFR